MEGMTINTRREEKLLDLMSIEKGCVIAGAYDEKSLKESSKRKVSAFNYPK